MRFLPLIFLIFAAFWASGASAQDLKPLPELRPSFNLESYAAQTDTIEKTFSDVGDLGFEISLPKDWSERSTLGQTYGELARYEGPAYGDVRPYFSLKRQQMGRENSARLELVAYMLKSGYVLRSLREIDDRNVEALYVVALPTGDSYAVRARVAVSGPAMLLAEYAVPVEAWDEQMDQQTFALSSFKFKNLSDDAIEKRIERNYFGSLRFFYPSSWSFDGEKADADNVVEIDLVNPGVANAELGRMAIALYGVKSLKDPQDKRGFKVDVAGILKDIRKTYTDQGYEFSDSIETRKPDLNLPAGFAVMDVYNLRQRLTQYETDKKAPVTKELWLAVFQAKDDVGATKTYIAQLLTPARSQDLYLWSINTRAFEIVMKSIQ